MAKYAPDQIIRGKNLDRLRFGHPAFIAERLQFDPDLSVPRKDVSFAYGKWMGLGKNFKSKDVHNLHVLLVFLGVVHDKATKRFHGVGLRK